MNVRIHFACLAALSGVSLLSAGAIGIATSSGPILLDNARTAGNATIFEGTMLQTEATTSQIELNGGARVRLGANSRGKLFKDSIDLEKGSTRIWGFAVNANGLTIRAEGTATVSLQGKVVEVAALEGKTRVFNANGINVANLLPGRVLNLRSQDGGASPLSVMVGCVTRSEGAFRLNDDVTSVTVQLRGGKFRESHRFRVTGTLVPQPVGDAVLQISAEKELAGGCGNGAVAAAATAGALGAAAGAATAGGIAAGISTTAVVAGVATAAAVGTAVGVVETKSSSSATGSSTQSSQLSGGK